MRADEPPKRLTMGDIAEFAGVHKSTVSRALQPGTAFYQSDTAKRIRSIVDATGFQLDRNASSLRTQRTGTIGVLVPRLTDNLMAVFYEAAAAACQDRDHVALVSITRDAAELQRHAGNALLGRRVDGLIMTSARIGDQYPAELAKRQVPFILALRGDPEHPSVVSDDAHGGKIATSYLLELGHRRIGLIAGPDHASTARGRRQGYRDAFREAGLPVDEDLVRPSRFKWQDGYGIALDWLDSPRPPTAIVAVNDEMAFAVIAAARTRGLDLPRDLSVVGYNDIPSAERPPLPLTTVRMDIGHLASEAVDMLMARINGRAIENRMIATSLVVRDSVAPPNER